MRPGIFTISSLLMAFAAVYPASSQRSFGSNYGVSVDAGLSGIGATGSVVLHKNFNARAGFGIMPFAYRYTMDELSVDLSEYNPSLGELTVSQDVNLKAKLNVPAGHVLVDYNPFKDGLGAFHVTAGLYFGGSRLVHVKGSLSDLEGLRQKVNEVAPGYGDFDISAVKIEVGDAKVGFNPDGSVNAYAEVNAVRPYLGVGWGNAIPRNRVGFRFDIGAMYHGKPEVTSPNLDGRFEDIDESGDFNKILGKVRFWPQLSFQLTFRLLPD